MLPPQNTQVLRRRTLKVPWDPLSTVSVCARKVWTPNMDKSTPFHAHKGASQRVDTTCGCPSLSFWCGRRPCQIHTHTHTHTSGAIQHYTKTTYEHEQHVRTDQLIHGHTDQTETRKFWGAKMGHFWVGGRKFMLTKFVCFFRLLRRGLMVCFPSFQFSAPRLPFSDKDSEAWLELKGAAGQSAQRSWPLSCHVAWQGKFSRYPSSHARSTSW